VNVVLKVKGRELQCSEAVRKLNPHLSLGGLEKPFAQSDLACALECDSKARKAGPPRMVISLVSYRSRLLDSDNLQGGLKPLRDAIAESLGFDDGDSAVRWEYGQVETQAEQGTAVRIQVL
jgi:hypothetical protein